MGRTALLSSLVLLLASIACSAGSDAQVGGSAGADTNSPSLFSGGGASSSGACAATPDGEGCPCQPGTVHGCYSGPASQAGVGACTLGKQTCSGEGESGGVWGACLG